DLEVFRRHQRIAIGPQGAADHRRVTPPLAAHRERERSPRPQLAGLVAQDPHDVSARLALARRLGRRFHARHLDLHVVRRLLALRGGFLWLVGYTFFVFHGVSFPLTPWSQAFINAIVKYTYDPGGRRGQNGVTVVLFREDNLRHLGVQYPVPYGVHAQVLEA